MAIRVVAAPTLRAITSLFALSMPLIIPVLNSRNLPKTSSIAWSKISRASLDATFPDFDPPTPSATAITALPSPHDFTSSESSFTDSSTGDFYENTTTFPQPILNSLIL